MKITQKSIKKIKDCIVARLRIISKKRVLAISIILFAIYTLVSSTALAYSIKLKSDGDKEYKNQNYGDALRVYKLAQKYWFPENINYKLRDRDLHMKIDKANIMVDSGENYDKGIIAFSNKQYEEVKRYFSLLTSKDPHFSDAEKILEIIDKEFTPSPTPALSIINKQAETSNISSTSNIQFKTYSIIPISVINIGAMEPNLQIIAQNAYQEFLRTPNLNQLDESNQMKILVDIYARMLRGKIADTQQNISQLKQENVPTYTITPITPTAIYINSEAETKLTELRHTLENIRNQPVAMNVIEGKSQKAYQDWVNNNQEIYAQILNSSNYSNQLNSILRAYGL